MSSYEITREWITDWLAKTGRDREWLAGQVGVAKRTIDNWYSRKLDVPLPVQILIRRIVQDEAQSRIRFTPEEFASIQQAMRATVHESVHEYLMDAALRMADEINRQPGDAQPPKEKE